MRVPSGCNPYATSGLPRLRRAPESGQGRHDREPAVQYDGLAGEETRAIRGEPDDALSHVLHGTDPAHGGDGGDLGHGLSVIAAQPRLDVEARGVRSDHPGVDAVDGDALRP